MQGTNSAAFADWYRRTHPGLTEMVLRSVPVRPVAEDATDEAFARAFANWDRVQAMRSPGGWVYRVAVNAARRQMWRASVEANKVDLAGRTTPTSVPPPAGETWLLVADLPIRQRTAVVLRHVARFTETEVAAAMGVTRSTVSSTLASAHRALGQLLAEPSTPEENLTVTQLQLAVARSCGPETCEAEEVATATTTTARYSDAVRGAIKVRPGDLVLLDPSTTPPTLVWRWWGGTVESVDGGRAVVSRNVTQRDATDPRRADMSIDLPSELAGTVAAGDNLWFGDEDGRKVAVAVASPEQAKSRIPAVEAALRQP